VSSWYGDPVDTLEVRAVEDGILSGCTLDSDFSAMLSKIKKKKFSEGGDDLSGLGIWLVWTPCYGLRQKLSTSSPRGFMGG